MAIDGPQAPTRKELSAALGNNQRLIRAFERIFDLLPSQFNIEAELIEEAVTEAGTAAAQSIEAIARSEVLRQSVEELQFSPPPPAIDLEARSRIDALEQRPATEPISPPRYGQFLRTVDATLSAANTAETISFNSADLSFGVAIDSGAASRIVVDRAGRYEFGATMQALSTTAVVKNIWFWFRLNGSNVSGSATKETLGTSNERDTPRLSRLFDLAPGDYVEIAWAADSTDVMLDFEAASAFAPSSPSVILSVKQIK